MIATLVALFWLAFAFVLFALYRWGTPLYVRYEMIILWDVPRMVDSQQRGW